MGCCGKDDKDNGGATNRMVQHQQPMSMVTTQPLPQPTIGFQPPVLSTPAPTYPRNPAEALQNALGHTPSPPPNHYGVMNMHLASEMSYNGASTVHGSSSYEPLLRPNSAFQSGHSSGSPPLSTHIRPPSAPQIPSHTQDEGKMSVAIDFGKYQFYGATSVRLTFSLYRYYILGCRKPLSFERVGAKTHRLHFLGIRFRTYSWWESSADTELARIF